MSMTNLGLLRSRVQRWRPINTQLGEPRLSGYKKIQKSTNTSLTGDNKRDVQITCLLYVIINGQITHK